MEVEQKERKEEAALQRSKLKEALEVHESKMKVLLGEISRLKDTADHYHENISKLSKRAQDMRDQIGKLLFLYHFLSFIIILLFLSNFLLNSHLRAAHSRFRKIIR